MMRNEVIKRKQQNIKQTEREEKSIKISSKFPLSRSSYVEHLCMHLLIHPTTDQIPQQRFLLQLYSPRLNWLSSLNLVCHKFGSKFSRKFRKIFLNNCRDSEKLCQKDSRRLAWKQLLPKYFDNFRWWWRRIVRIVSTRTRENVYQNCWEFVMKIEVKSKQSRIDEEPKQNSPQRLDTHQRYFAHFILV